MNDVETCAACGQALDRGHGLPSPYADHAATSPSSPGPAFGIDLTNVEDRAATPDLPPEPVDRRLRLSGRTVALAVAGLAGLWLLAVLVAPDTEPVPDEVAEATPEPTAVTESTATAQPEAEPIPAAPTPATPAEEVAAVAPVGDAGGVGIMIERPTRTERLDGRVVFRTSEGLATYDLAEGTYAPAPIDLAPTPLRGSWLLRTNDGITYGVDPSDPSATRVAAVSGVVVRTLVPGLYTFLDSAAPTIQEGTWATIGRSRDDVNAFRVELPVGAKWLSVEGRGLVILPEQGGAQIVTLDGLEPLSGNEVISANARYRIERECLFDDQCQLVVTEWDAIDGLSRRTTPMPDRFAQDTRRFIIAPDGRAVLRITNSGDGEVFFADSGNIAFADEGIADAVWGPDSTFVVWLNFNEDDPRLSIMYAYEPNWDSIQLEQPGVLLPAGPELLMVPS